jgi:hypothetical protein
MMAETRREETYRCVHALAQLRLEGGTALVAVSLGGPAVYLQ